MFLRNIKFNLFLSAIITASLFCVSAVWASTTDGTIDPVAKYAWGENIGWINFGATNGNVHVTDATVTGYAWSPNYGWINLSPTTDGVANDGEGNLSGYAWGENLGWINFANITISSSGLFSGIASGTVAGQISFDCLNCAVVTDWRPASARQECGNGILESGEACDNGADNGVCPKTCSASCVVNSCQAAGGGGGGQPPISIPSQNGRYQIGLLSGDMQTTDNPVRLLLSTDSSAVNYIWLSDNSNFIPATRAFFSSGQKQVEVSYQLTGGYGDKKIYARFCNQNNECGPDVFATFEYKKAEPPPDKNADAPTSSSVKIISEESSDNGDQNIDSSNVLTNFFTNLWLPAEKMIGVVSEIGAGVKDAVKQLAIDIREFSAPSVPLAGIFKKLEFLVPPFMRSVAPAQPLPSAETLIARLAPDALNGKWNIMPQKQIREFVFAPLPEDLRALSAKFAGLQNTLKQVGVERMAQANKLESVQLNLPGLTNASGVKSPDVAGQPPTAVSLRSLSLIEKKQIPSEVVFARSNGDLIDYNILLTISDTGQPEQKIATIAGKTLDLVVRPDMPAEKIMGYFVFRSRAISAAIKVNVMSWVESLVFALPALAQPVEKPITGEDRLVLMSFEYTDPDHDGLYTASVQAPVASGEYEVITVITYKDRTLGAKELRLVTVVDPEGYVYEMSKGREVRLAGANVTIEWLNTNSGKYELWPANNYQQENPQKTNHSGNYSFLVPEGTYRLRAQADGYDGYFGQSFDVREGGGVHFNIALSPIKKWWRILDWRTGLVLLMAVLLVYNFYRDNKRKKLLK